MHIRQHLPPSIRADPQTVQFNTAEELLAIPFVAAFRAEKSFVRFSLYRDDLKTGMLMAEYENRWHVIGFVSEDVPDLPTWQPPRRGRDVDNPRPYPPEIDQTGIGPLNSQPPLVACR